MQTTLSQPDVQALLSRLPKIEPCYEKTDTAIPDNYTLRVSISVGKKYHVWIQYDESGDAAFFMELNKEKKISVVTRHYVCDATLLPFSKGTAMYGTIYEHASGRQVFLIEDVYYYCGMSVAKETFARKLRRMRHIVEKLGNTLPIWVRLPHITSAESVSDAGYTEHHAQYRMAEKLAPYVNLVKDDVGPAIVVPVCERPLMCDFSKPQFRQVAVFWAKADVQFDIYNLYCSKDVFCGVAGIQTYKTSVLLNTLFRKIRANQNLDAIEESDDEDTFEDVRETKWVADMSNKVKMVCEFNAKLRKWVPVRVADEGATVVSADKLR
jgi:hypothetical protein